MPGAASPGSLALVGCGEYLPVLEDVERELLAGRPPRLVQLATAAASGLAAVPHLRVLPHVDRFAARLPDLLLVRVVDTPAA